MVAKRGFTGLLGELDKKRLQLAVDAFEHKLPYEKYLEHLGRYQQIKDDINAVKRSLKRDDEGEQDD